MMKNLSLLFVIMIFALCSCKSNSNETHEKETIPVKVETKKVTINRLPPDYVRSINASADALEGTFYESGKSISLWNENVKNIFVMMIDAPPSSLDAKLVGHVMYLNKGNELAFVEIFLSSNNNYVCYKIDETKYYNKLNAEGVKFFTNMATKIQIETNQKH